MKRKKKFPAPIVALVMATGQLTGIAVLPAPAQAATPVASARASAADTATGSTTADLARRANDHYERARAAQRADDGATYGTEMKRLGEVLRQLGAQRSAAPR